MESVYRKFAHYEQPINDFERARQQISTPFDYFDVDLSSPRTNEIFNISGDFIYIDMASTGYATMELNNQHDARKAPFLIRKGFALGATFKQLKISNNAQVGAFIRIMFSTGDRVIPALGDVNISGNVNTVDNGYTFGGNHKSITSLVANTPEVVVAPAANLNGILIHDARFFSVSGTTTNTVLIAKTGNPATVIDGQVLLMGDSSANTTSRDIWGSLKQAVRVPAGYGLYFISTINENNGQRMVNYDLL